MLKSLTEVAQMQIELHSSFWNSATKSPRQSAGGTIRE
jgi:hypothetical protein